MRTIPRTSTVLQCLERSIGGKTYDIPIPVQTDFTTYGTECDVTLKEVPQSQGACNPASLVVGRKLAIAHDKSDNSFTVTLTDPSSGEVISGKPEVHGAPDDVRYLEYNYRAANPERSIDYYFYLVDPDPGSAEQQKYFLVEAFDNLNTSQACDAERPNDKLKVKDKCADPSLFLRVTPSGGDGVGDVSTRQTDTGGGYEPPK